jgi:L-alanine-DL-glutamate epimerase-like enolase superfamily enzyme
MGHPAGRLLGGVYRDRVRAYASTYFYEPGEMREHVAALKERGFRAIKMGWAEFGRASRANDELLIRTAREATGPDIMLMVDAGGSDEWWSLGFKWALDRARMLGEYEVAWFEEPLAPDNISGFELLCEHSPIPIATGQELTRRQSFSPLIERRAADIIQPDVTKVGGLSEMRKLGWAAHDAGIELIGHGWNTAVGLAADLQLAAALPAARLVEYQTDSPYIDGIVPGTFVLDQEGCLAIPQGPGLNLELDWERVVSLSRSSKAS